MVNTRDMANTRAITDWYARAFHEKKLCFKARKITKHEKNDLLEYLLL